MGKTFAILMSFAMGLGAAAVSAKTNMLYILDSSNSMWGQIDGVPKMDTAKSVLNEALNDLDIDIAPGLIIYGHRTKGDCSDVELVAPFGSSSVADLKASIGAIAPRGKTPLAESLRQSWEAFEGREEDNNLILLISDGIETCGGDPCNVAQDLADRGVNLRVNVVGFDVDAETRAQLQCIADNGNGQYFDAKNASEFSQAIVLAQEVEPEPMPEPVATGPNLYFVDHFDGDDLSEDWSVARPNPDNYLVEDGFLTLVSRDGTSPTFGAGENILRLNKPIPKGDWVITLRFVLPPQTMGEMMRVGVARDEATSLLSAVEWITTDYATTKTNLRIDKLTKGEASGFTRSLLNISGRDIQLRALSYTQQVAAMELRLTKSGRNYESALRFAPTEQVSDPPLSDEWQPVQPLTALRPPGDAFTIIFGSASSGYTPAEGEGLVDIDWVKIETPG